MMGNIPNNVRQGLSNFFYAVYKNDVNEALDGLVGMGVLVPNSSADMTAIKRTGQFFLDSFKTRLREQREEENASRSGIGIEPTESKYKGRQEGKEEENFVEHWSRLACCCQRPAIPLSRPLHFCGELFLFWMEL